MINLPAAFTERMKQMLGREYDAFIASYDKERSQGLRVNGLKADLAEFAKTAPFSLNPVAWAAEGFAYGAEDRPGRHPYHDAGVYYIQEPSAMIAASLLNPQPGEMILDLCAAPGGKSTQAAARLSGEGLLVSNEIHPARAKILSQNIERMGIRNAVVTNEDSGRLTKYFPAFFDGIIVDAPCSGEGMFRKDETAVTEWSPENVRRCAGRQQEILENAAMMLKPGGRLVYSTCTFDPKENEQVIEHLLKTYPEFRILKIAPYEGFVQGMPEVTESRDPSLADTVRIFPHKMKGEGHYLALVQKGEPCDRVKGELTGGKGKKKLPEELEEFLNDVKKEIRTDLLDIHGERVYVMPAGLPNLKGLRFLRTGLLLGELKKKRFEPSQAFAMTLKKDDYEKIVDLPLEDDRVSRYLKGETLDVDDLVETKAKGWYLVCVDGYPLGWGKLANGTLKNKYLPGWRLNS